MFFRQKKIAMKQLIPFFYLFLFISTWLDAQQVPLFTQYRENQSLINPASIHADNIGYSFRPNSSAGLSYRYQWVDLKSGPRTMIARYEHIMEDLSMLTGLTLIRDATGPTSTTGAYLRYAYQVEFSRYSLLSIGFSSGILQSSLNGNKGVTRDAGDAKSISEFNAIYFEFNPGVFYKSTLGNEDDFYIGLSFPQLFSTKFIKIDNESYIKKEPHVFAQVGLYKYLGDGFGSLNGAMFLEPSLWFKYVVYALPQLDMNIRFQMAELFWIGTGYSIAVSDQFYGNNLHMEFGVTLNTVDDRVFKIGYGFDKSITTFGPRFGSTHEINLTYSWLR